MIRSVECAVGTVLSERSVQKPGSAGSWAAAVLETSEGPLGQDSCRPSAVRQALGWEEPGAGGGWGWECGAGNVELALAQSGLRAVYSRTLGLQGIPTGSRTVEGM